MVYGYISAIRGPVVDVRFETDGVLPKLNDELNVEENG